MWHNGTVRVYVMMVHYSCCYSLATEGDSQSPLTFLISEVVSRAWEGGGGTEDAAAKCDQSTPCIAVDQAFLHVWNWNNSLTPNPSGDIFLNWIMKIDCFCCFWCLVIYVHYKKLSGKQKHDFVNCVAMCVLSKTNFLIHYSVAVRF